MAYRRNSEGLRIFSNLRYARHPRLIDNLPRSCEVSVITDIEGTKSVVVKYPIYKNGPFVMEQTFSSTFSDAEILCSTDVQNFLVDHFGFKKCLVWM